MALKRRGEESGYPFRSQRLSCENGKWYFHTREGTPFGPFRDQAQAKNELAVFVAQKIGELPAEQLAASAGVVVIEEELRHMVQELLGFFGSRNEAGVSASLAWAHSRIAELRQDWQGRPTQRERIDILFYAMDLEAHFAHR